MRERFNDLSNQAVETYNTARERAGTGLRSAYSSARDYPGTIAAVVVGLGIAGFMLWAARRNGGWRNLKDNAAERARQGYDAVKQRASRIRGQQELAE